jgi:hypothetical protein
MVCCCVGGYDGKQVLSDFYKFRLKPIGVPPMALVNDFRRLVNSPDMSDVTFIIDDKEFYAHGAILATRSEYFRALLFNGHMSESVSKSITLSDISPTVFLKVLEFLYTDTISVATIELGINILIASEHFMLDRLKSLCEDAIRREISIHSVIHILVVSHQHHALGLKEIALGFILENLKDRDIQSALPELKAEPDLLVEIIQLISSQHTVTKAAAPQQPNLFAAQSMLQEMGSISGGPFGAGEER